MITKTFKPKSEKTYQYQHYTKHIRQVSKDLLKSRGVDLRKKTCSECGTGWSEDNKIEIHHYAIEKTGTAIGLLCTKCHNDWHRNHGKQPPTDFFGDPIFMDEHVKAYEKEIIRRGKEKAKHALEIREAARKRDLEEVKAKNVARSAAQDAYDRTPKGRIKKYLTLQWLFVTVIIFIPVFLICAALILAVIQKLFLL